MGSLGHGLPASQLEELIKDMGMDEDVDRTIFRRPPMHPHPPALRRPRPRGTTSSSG